MTRVLGIGVIISLFILFWACTPLVTRRLLSPQEMGITPEAFEQTGVRRLSSRSPCYNQDNYLCDTNHIDHRPMHYLRINFHWMNSEDGSQNIPESAVKSYTHDILKALNYALENNKQSWLPHGNELPIHPINFRYVLTGHPDSPDDDGIYYHYDDSLYYYVHYRKKHSNLYSKEVINKYATQLDTVLNIFMMPHHPDSVASSTYHAGPVGVALRNTVKVAAPWIEDFGRDRNSYWSYRGVINHEVGHILGLSHAWLNSDGCNDTPSHKNPCWSRTAKPGCDTLTSNNVMDYNALQLAWTPCQIAKVQKRFSDPRLIQRKFLEPRWCERNPDADITITDTVEWKGMRDLYGNLTIAYGGHLTIRCRTSIPEHGKITIQSGGTLLIDGAQIHQSCGKTWQGIEVEEMLKQEGQLILRANTVIDNVAIDSTFLEGSN